MALESILIVPDTHAPYHDQRAWNLMLKVAKAMRPKHVIVLGDFVDFYAVSSHSKDPARTASLEEEIELSLPLLKDLASLDATNKVFIAGNHEDRLTRYLQEKAPELFKSVTIPKVLRLREHGFKYVPYRDVYRLGKVLFTHDTGVAGVGAPRKGVAAFQHSVVIGHTHRMEYHIEGTADGTRHVGASFGWLGDAQAVDYMHRIKVLRDWTLGFGVGHLDTSTGFVYLQPIPLVNYTCVVGGKIYK